MSAAASAIRRQVDASPEASDFAKEAGAEITYNADGSWEGVVRGKDNIRRAMDMQDGARAIEIERGARLQSTRPAERMVDPTGKVRDVPVHLSDKVAEQPGWKPKINWGRPTAKWVARDGGIVRVL